MPDAVAERFLGNGQQMCSLFLGQVHRDPIINADGDVPRPRSREGGGQCPERIGDGLLEDEGTLRL